MDSRENILHLMHQYCVSIDTGSCEGFAKLFEHASWITEGSEPVVGRAGIEKLWEQIIIYEDGTPRTKHFVSNVDLAIDEAAGTATAESYLTLYQQTDEFPLQVCFVGHYFDDFERVDGSWRFAKRVIRNSLVGDLSAHLRAPGSVIPEA
ncbi:MAG: nuclear transport factor 2 family protein [Myxococcales bacterium]|nr:nuclear transport factor 2 family protein [Myxococcales bacterium]